MTCRRRVVFVGAYGIRNAGDDAPLLFLTRALRAAHPGVEFEFSLIARHRDPELERASGATFLPNLEHESRAAARGRFFRGFNPGDGQAELAAAERAIAAADLLVAGAGNVLFDLSLGFLRGPIALLSIYAWLADLWRRPLFLYGISAGPLATGRGRALSAWIARRSAAVTVRDAGSAELLRTLAPGVEPELLPDPALGLAPADEPAFEAARASEGIPRRAARPRLALALRDLSFLEGGGEPGRQRALIVATLRRLAGRFEFLFVPQSTYAECDDREEAAAVSAQLGPEARCHVVRGRHAPEVLMRFYGTAEATLAVRLHGAVFSVRAGTPVVALGYLPKVRGFLERVGGAGACFELDGIGPDGLARALEEAAASRGRSELAQHVQQLAGGTAGYVRRVAELLGLELSSAAREPGAPAAVC